ncbi:MAG: CoA-acylating methylmalonate-semialdehyde dehydrogenase [Gammaproteobacteria bacterium]|nr:CoA-acylating methylmalonate-semialdehyde dehydrogenase [Gammaproteobacteria bacterium]
MVYKVPHFIDGSFIYGSGEKLQIFNPATSEIAGELDVADINLVNQAVESAKVAFQTWSKTSPAFRAKFLFRYKALLDQHRNELATLVTQEHGKTLVEAHGSIQRGIDVLDFACGISSHLKGDFAEEVATGVDCYGLRQPLGVCVGITPFNFPAMIPLWMFPLSIACGNTFILKPSEKDPSCSIKLIELAKEAELPNGVVNVLQGNRETVTALVQHRDIKAVSFVGSTPVAEQVYQMATAAHKRVQAFGGAKNHCVIMPDADFAEAAKMIVEAAFGSAGERCMAISVIVAVGEKTADELLSVMRPLIAKLQYGPGNQAHVDIGPLITKEHHQRVMDYIDLGISEGAKLILDGRNLESLAKQAGFFMGASVFNEVTPQMRIYQEEIFGPVLSVMTVADLDEAIHLISEHEYGNGTAIFTRDGYTARQFADQVQVGMVGINVPVPVPVAYHSFGGWKRSIFSDIGMYGDEGVRFYTKLKTVTTRWFPKE